MIELKRMSSIVWFVSIAIMTRLVDSKFIDNELRAGLQFNRDFRHINLEDNEAINTFETSRYRLRYKTQQRYRGLPVFGATLVAEQDPGDASQRIPIYGRWYDKTDIQQLVPSINPEFGEDEALQIALTALHINSNNVYSQSPGKLYIYYHDSFPFLCWIIKVSYSNPRKGDDVHHPVVIINALTGRVFQIYDEVFNINAGSSGIEACGDGGNLKTGLYRYCVDYPSLLINDNIIPVLENDVIQVYDNHGNPYYSHTNATKVTCSGSVSNVTHNVTGNHTSPSCYIDDVYTNGAYCPACDIYAFANAVFEMFDQWSNATYPISAAFVPMKLFVHVGYNWVNANFDPSSGAMNFGDGATSWYPLTTLDITAHEIAHGYTDQGSDLIYSGESGGMNEAFSDIVGEVAEYWFFGENDWMIGGEVFKNVGEALRYMDDPPNDGVSIDHYSNYYSSMDVHYSSGLYNKAAYNLNTNGSNYNWSMEEIFRVFAWANLYYWTADSTFNEGVSGLYQALYDLYDNNMTDVDAMADELDIAFLDVGLARINTSIPDNVLCGSNRFCYYENINASRTAITNHTVSIQADDDSSVTYFDIYFTVNDNDCMRPTLSFKYELIDYDSSSEYIDVFDMNDNLINRCQGGFSCGTFDSSCIHNYDLGVSAIRRGETYKIAVVESAEVDDLCGTGPTINAFLTLQCEYGTVSPTAEPTTAEPTQPTTNPTTVQPTLNPTTAQPTQPTTNPTPYPTNEKIDCGVNTFCYIVDVYPSLSAPVENTVIIQNPDDNSDTYFNVFFIIHGNDCVSPQISFEHELIDYDSITEYIELFDNSGNNITRCQGAYICNQFSACLTDYDLGVNKIIAEGDHYQITVFESISVDSLCYAYHTNSINARLKLSCAAGTADPTTEPTVDPTTEPTVNPTTFAPTQPTVNPTTSAPTTFAPTQPTSAPTPIPPNTKVACGSNRWCFYSPVTPNSQYDTEWNVLIQNEYVSGTRYFDIYFTINNETCFNPQLTFIYERIDYDNSIEYIDVFGGGALIQRCGAGAQSNLCSSYDTCLSQTDLAVNQIEAGTTYQISLTESTEVNAFCYSHLWSINANATLHCHPRSNMSSTFEPTTEPTVHPTLAPTQPTANPPYCPFTQGTISCDESVTGTIVAADTHCYKFVPNINTVSTVTFSDCSSDFDPKLFVYSESGEWISQPYCDGDDCGADQCGSSLREVFSIPNMNLNEVYYVLIEPYSSGGIYTIDIQCNATESIESTFDPWMDMSTTMDTPTTMDNPCECSSDVCYSVDAIGSNYEQVTTNTVINNINDNTAKSLGICYNIIGAPCRNPRFSFEYERIDYDSDMEYLLIYDDNDTLLRNCGGNVSNVCGVFAECLSEYKLDIDSIDENSTYQMTIIQSYFVNALCENNNHSAYSINAGAKLHCGAETNNPTAIPTTIPSIEPTTNPTVISTAIPTTNPTAIPTASPTDSSCKVDKCYYETVKKKLTTTTVTNYEDSDISLINVEYRFADYNCGNPRLSFEYEKVDVDGPSEYITVEANDTLIADCGARTNECGKMESCFTNTRLDWSPVYVGQTLKISIAVSEESNALCETSDHQLYTINAVLKLRCNQIAVADAATAVDEGAFSDPLFAFGSTVSVVVYILILLFFCMLLAVVIYCWVQRKNRRMDKNDIENSVEMADVRSLDAAPQEKRDEMDEMSTEVLGQETLDIGDGMMII